MLSCAALAAHENGYTSFGSCDKNSAGLLGHVTWLLLVRMQRWLALPWCENVLNKVFSLRLHCSIALMFQMAVAQEILEQQDSPSPDLALEIVKWSLELLATQVLSLLLLLRQCRNWSCPGRQCSAANLSL